MKKDPLIYKVRPVTDKIPADDESWDLSTYHDEPNPKLASKYGDRKVLLVRYDYPNRATKDSLLEGDGSYGATPAGELKNSELTEDQFYIDVPTSFFKQLGDEGALGDFEASPRYSPRDVLYVKWTGWGRHSGWIDLNIQQRGAGGGGTTTVEGGCAKWS